MNVLTKFGVCCLLASSCLLFACSNLTRSDKPAVTTWWLKPYSGSPAASVAEPPVQVALTVTAIPGLDSDQILTLSADAELKPYAGARWAEYLPELVTSLLGRSLEASGRFEVQSEWAGAGPQRCDLQLQLTEFFAESDPGGSSAVVNVAAKGHFYCGSAAPVAIAADASVPADGNRMNVIVAAFQQALDRVTKQILDKI
jgi:cholesterol transport system auxiliary component